MVFLKQSPIINRDISWLSFNERVLQEAECKDVPLLERLKFIGIFSNNLDEFFRVRVATLRRMKEYSKEAQEELGIDPEELLDAIMEKVLQLQKRFDAAYFQILADMEKENILIVNEKQLNEPQADYVKKYFRDKVRLEIFPIMLDKNVRFPTLHDSSIYLAVRFYNEDVKDSNYSILEIPTSIPRFVVLPAIENKICIMFLDDVIRFNLEDIYKIYDFKTIDAYTIKFNKDAELELDNDVTESFLETVELSLKQRKNAKPLRLIYDAEMPNEFLQYLLKKMNFNRQGHVAPGVRYHNFKDFIKFPKVHPAKFWNQDESFIPHPQLENCRSILDKMKSRDIFLYYPYHSFDYFLDLLREAAIDPDVSHIRMTVYRLSSHSHVVKSLLTALKNGKDVTVMIELRARFDEAANIDWANKLKDEGAKVITGINGLKVHSKICLITRREKGKKIYYGCLGSGNFHEVTAKFYTDIHLLTADQSITRELRELFNFFDKNYLIPKLQRLTIAPFNLRSKLISWINREIRNARTGKRAEIFIKVNSLVDEALIQKLYYASKAGVKIRLIVRGTCSLIPGLPKVSENIEAISIVDQYLEHSRVFIFYNNGREEVYFGSADLMTRNIDYRIEVIAPVLNIEIRQQLIDLMELQWQDNTKARIFDADQNNNFRTVEANQRKLRSQITARDYFIHLYQLTKATEFEISSN